MARELVISHGLILFINSFDKFCIFLSLCIAYCDPPAEHWCYFLTLDCPWKITYTDALPSLHNPQLFKSCINQLRCTKNICFSQMYCTECNFKIYSIKHIKQAYSNHVFIVNCFRTILLNLMKKNHFIVYKKFVRQKHRLNSLIKHKPKLVRTSINWKSI